MIKKQVPFRPKLEGEFKKRFYTAVSSITKNTTKDEIINLSDTEIKWVENDCLYNIEQRKKYRATWYLLRDLVSASYKAEYLDGTLLMTLPSLDKNDLNDSSMTEVKTTMRSWMAESRHERIVAGKEFVMKMEKGSSSKKPIETLIADGTELAGRLNKFKTGEITIEEAIDPRLELVEEDKRDVGFTEQKLSDIWQYFRLTWSTAYENTPGRTVRYLIRDYAHPMHAVMGIMSLENCTMQLSTRDDFLGWTLKAFTEEITSYDGKGIEDAFERLLNNIQTGIDGIDYSEICSAEDIKEPTMECINSINSIALDAENRRKKLLLEESGATAEYEKSNLGKISKEAEIMLYRKKRAEQLAKLLSAKRAIVDFLNSGRVAEGALDFCKSDVGGSAIHSALVAQKSTHIGSSLMELNVCGAIPPYNHILGGKLVALLATSPQVIHDYKCRYADKPSEIASRMKGESVTRSADLVFLGTTSLYYVGSSQYNRLKIPGSVFNNSFDIKWQELGTTIGFGTMHISRTTTMCLSEAVGDDSKLINNVFGEGASPKFRLLAKGVSTLLESSHDADPKEFTKHAMSRIVYGACLAKNTKRYLLGYDTEPEYYTDIEDYEKGTQQIIDFWRTRWLISRLNFEPIFDRITSFKPSDILVSNEFIEDESIKYSELKEVSMALTTKKDKIDFVRGFYRGSSAFAENIPEELLNIIHVPTKLDTSILDDISNGKDVVLTGNAGDGKTHIIKMLTPEICKLTNPPDIMLDASESTSEQIYSRWLKAHNEGKPFVVAINAAVLFALYEYCENNAYNFKPVQTAFSKMKNAINFHGNFEEEDSNVIVYDLNQRNILDKAFVKSAIKKLTSDKLFEECSECKLKEICPVKQNRLLMNSELFQERLCFILNRVSIQGHHATLRELQELISFLIFGDKKCDELGINAGKNDNDIINLLYSTQAKGNLLKEIRNSFDPIRVSHPVYDEIILSNQIDSNTWSEHYQAPMDSITSSNIEEFNLRKRQFFFFNENGEKYIEVNDDMVSRFEAFLAEEQDKALRKQIVKKLDCFFETEPSNDLVIWTGHRFDNQPRKVLLSIGSLPDHSFTIGRPHLSPEMQRGFNSTNNYVRFERKSSADEGAFLKIDYGMFELLSQAEKGVPALFMESDLVKKVWRFVEQLQSLNDYKDAVRLSVSVLDVQTKQKMEVTIDLEDNQYSTVKIEHREH